MDSMSIGGRTGGLPRQTSQNDMGASPQQRAVVSVSSDPNKTASERVSNAEAKALATLGDKIGAGLARPSSEPDTTPSLFNRSRQGFENLVLGGIEPALKPSALTDANLQTTNTRQQLGNQFLAIANQPPQSLLSLLR
jgi:hypothetical protein